LPLSSKLVHGRRADQVAARRFDQRVSVLEATTTQDDTGAPLQAWTVLAGHAEVLAMVSVPTRGVGRGRSAKERTVEMTIDTIHRVALLDGYFPAVSPLHRLRIADGDYGIEAVDWDSQQTITRIQLRKVS
jgi:hypothetical protein